MTAAESPPIDSDEPYRGPGGAAVVRRALLVWGAGHLALGEKRGWLLLLLQLLAVGALVVLGALFVEGTRWIAVFAALAVLIALWIGQAIHAHRRAMRRGAPAGGEFQIALLLPLAVVLLSSFWLVAGGRATPAATVQHYVAAWQADRPDAAQPLFAQPVDSATLAVEWQAQRDYIEHLVAAAAARYGVQSGLDPDQPFNSLRFEQAASSERTGRAVVTVEVVRQERVESELFGLIPTATQQTVLIEPLGHVLLRVEPARVPEWLPLGHNPSRVWLIAEVELAGPSD